LSSFAESYLGRLRAVIGRREIIIPGARVLIQNPQGELLLELKNESGPEGRLWGFPGGCAELGESIDQVAHRELLEETGLTVQTFIPFGFASDPLHERAVYPNGDAYHGYAMLFLGKDYAGEIRTQEGENIALAFHSPDRLPDNLQHYVPRTIEALQRFSATGAFQFI